MLNNIIQRVIPTIILAIIFGIFTMHLTVASIELRQTHIIKVQEARFKYILQNHDDIIRMKEELKCNKEDK